MKEKTKITIGITATFFLLTLFVAGIIFIVTSKNEKVSEKTTQITNLAEGEVVKDKTVNLNDYASNITIKDSGEYTLSGTLKYSLIINATGDVTLNLNNVTIASLTSGGIIGKSCNKLTINLIKNTINTISDGGSSSYDAAIYSNSSLIIDGEGKLTVNGLQSDGEGIATNNSDLTINNGTIIINSNDDGLNAGGDGGTITINGGTLNISANGDGIDSNKDAIINGGLVFVNGSAEGGNAAIDTDLGFVINGGTVIALGSDMLENPKDTSKQYCMSFNLNDYIEASSVVSLQKTGDEIITFKSPKKYKTLIISTSKITKGTYKLYKDGTDVADLSNGIYQSKKYKDGILIGTYKLTNQIGIYGETNE